MQSNAAGGGGNGGGGGPIKPLHDPSLPGALVLNQGQLSAAAGCGGRLPDGRHVTAVVVDPWLGKSLRPHQEEGVKFLYR